MFYYNGNKLSNIEKEYLFRKEKKNEYLELYFSGKDDNDKISVNLMFDIVKEKLNMLELYDEEYISEYLIGEECYFGINNDYSLLNIEDLNIKITKIDKNKYQFKIDSYINKFTIESDIIFEVEKE